MKFFFIVLVGLISMSNIFSQCKPLDLSMITLWLSVPDNAKDALFEKAGFEKAIISVDKETGINYSYNACWIDFKDGYKRYAQTVTWIPAYKIVSFVTLDEKNYVALKNEIKKIAKYTGTEQDSTENYETPAAVYSIQVVDFNEPLQKKHPSYSFAFALKK